MSFWGAEVTTGKVSSWVPPPDPARLHLSQIVLSHVTRPSPYANMYALECKTQDMGPFRLALLGANKQSDATATVDLVFDQYTEFSLTELQIGSMAPKNPPRLECSVHLTGYHMPMEEEHDHEEEDEEEPALSPQEMSALRRQFAQGGMPQGLDEDEEDEEDGDYEFGMQDSSESEDYDDSISEEDDEFEDRPSTSSVIIEEVTDFPEEAPARSRLSLLGTADASTSAPTAAVDIPPPAGQATPTMANGSADGTKPLTKSQKKAARKRAAQEAAADGVAPATTPVAQSTPLVAQAGSTAAAPAASTPPADPPGKAKKRKNSDAGATPGPQKRAATSEASSQSPAATIKASAPAGKSAKEDTPLSKKNIKRYANGFEVHDLAIGQPDGKAAQAGQRVTVEYIGSLQKNGKVFDQSKSFAFRLGLGEVIKGWDLGVAGMRVGDRRKLVIPPQLAYGKEGARGAIPPNATLEFTVKLLKVK